MSRAVCGHHVFERRYKKQKKLTFVRIIRRNETVVKLLLQFVKCCEKTKRERG